MLPIRIWFTPAVSAASCIVLPMVARAGRNLLENSGRFGRWLGALNSRSFKPEPEAKDPATERHRRRWLRVKRCKQIIDPAARAEPWAPGWQSSRLRFANNWYRRSKRTRKKG